MRRNPTAMLVVLLLAAACGRDGGSRATRTATPTPAHGTAAPDAPSPAAVGSSVNPALTPRPATSPKPLPEDPAATVSLFLSAMDAEDYATQRAASTDAVRALARIRDIISQENAFRGASTDSRVTIAEEPKVTASSGAQATLSLRAVEHSVVSGEKGTEEADTTIAGPVTLRKVDGRWRVADLVYQDGALAPGWVYVNSRTSSNGTTLVVGELLSYKQTTAVLVRLQSDSDEPVGLRITNAALYGPDGSEKRWHQFAFERPAAAPAGFLGFPRIEGRPQRLKVDVALDRDPSKSWSYEVTLPS